MTQSLLAGPLAGNIPIGPHLQFEIVLDVLLGVRMWLLFGEQHRHIQKSVFKKVFSKRFGESVCAGLYLAFTCRISPT